MEAEHLAVVALVGHPAWLAVLAEPRVWHHEAVAGDEVAASADVVVVAGVGGKQNIKRGQNDYELQNARSQKSPFLDVHVDPCLLVWGY